MRPSDTEVGFENGDHTTVCESVVLTQTFTASYSFCFNPWLDCICKEEIGQIGGLIVFRRGRRHVFPPEGT